MRQGLVERVERDGAFDAGVDVDIHFGVARQREQQFLHRNIVYHDAIGFRLESGFGRGQRRGLLHRFRNISDRTRFVLDVAD